MLNLKQYPGQGGKFLCANSDLDNLPEIVKACAIDASLKVSYCWGLSAFEKEQQAKLVW